MARLNNFRRLQNIRTGPGVVRARDSGLKGESFIKGNLGSRLVGFLCVTFPLSPESHLPSNHQLAWRVFV